MGEIMLGTVYTLEVWNTIEYKNHPESSIAGKRASIRLLCVAPINCTKKKCGAHFFDIDETDIAFNGDLFVTDRKTGEKMQRIKCNACSQYKTRKLGTLPIKRK